MLAIGVVTDEVTGVIAVTANVSLLDGVEIATLDGVVTLKLYCSGRELFWSETMLP